MARLAAQGDQPGTNLPAQPIGAADLLAISVYGAPELTRTVRVSPRMTARALGEYDGASARRRESIIREQ